MPASSLSVKTHMSKKTRPTYSYGGSGVSPDTLISKI
ncbi:hypothetical protein IMAU50151_00084 [Lactobacillus helveticus]|nr:hypothetical protein [Lactobacillus helveticus]